MSGALIPSISERWHRLRSSNIQIAVVVIVTLAAIMGSFVFDQVQRYDDAIARADRDTRNAAVLLAEGTARTFESIDETLRAVASLHRDVQAGHYRDKTTIFTLLKAIHGGSPELRVVGWTDADGNRVASSLSAERPPLNIADQEHFTAQRDRADHGLYIAEPIHSKLTRDTIINVSRRLESDDGRFAGIASGVVEPKYFASVYRTVELGSGRIVALFRSDGVVLTREPELDERIGRSAATSVWFQELLPKAPVGTFHGRNIFDGSERILSYARVSGAPLIVSVSLPRSAALLDYRKELLRSGLRLGLTILVLAGGAWLLAVQLKRRQRADGQFRELLEAAPEAMIITDKQGRIALANTQAERLFGYPRSELIGQPIVTLIPERYRKRHPAHLAGFADNPEARPMGTGLELRGLRKDGSEFPVEISLSPLQTDAGLLLSSAIRDISDRKLVEAELVRAQRAAEAANRAKSDFLSSMSHELRTPLNAVIGFAQMLQIDRKHPLTAKQEEYVGYIVRGGDHLLELVNEVLDLSGIEAGRLKLTPKRVNVSVAIDDAHRTLSPLAAKAGITFDVRIPEGISDVLADKQRLRQILINLASNAIKYNRAGGSVHISAASESDGRVRIIVADTGIGISAEHRKDLFQPFQRLGAEHTGAEGTGVGLALSKRLVEAMGGSIGCESEAGKGSTFWIELPADASSLAPIEAEIRA